MKKRLLSIALAVVLVCGLSVPAAAAETAAAAEIRSAVNLIKTIHLPTLQIRTVRRE